MNICGIIAEYNPFHNGHKLQIERTRNMGFSHVVCVMSGSFVQRGDIAIMDKWSRAEMAIKNGCDLVVELPASFCLASANTFANAGVFILNQLGANALCFGSECGDIDLLNKTAQAVLTASESDKLSKALKTGVSYPTALHNSIDDPACRALLEHANNTLGIEYINAIKKQGHSITATTIMREQAEHDSLTSGETIASASLIRKLIYENKLTHLSEVMPENAVEIARYVVENGSAPAVQSKIEPMLLYKLKTMNPMDFLEVPDVIEGLENRLVRAISEATSFNEFLTLAKTKRYTMARLRRIAYCCLLGITKAEQSVFPRYIRVLASNKRGYEVLSLATKTATVPIETKFKTLYDFNPAGLKADILSTDLFNLATERPQRSGIDFLRSPIKG